MSREISALLRQARRHILNIPGVEILEDLTWSPAKSRWTLHFQVECSNYQPTGLIPASTRWYALISPDYPHGEVSIFPAVEGGITATFQHQLLNRAIKGCPWTAGEICVETSTNNWGRNEFKDQPTDPELRLSWYIQRSVDWLTAAATGKLAIPGEPFEMPQIPVAVRSMIVFNEDDTTFQWWQQQQIRVGHFEIKSIPGITDTFATISFSCDKQLLEHKWGKNIQECKGIKYQGIWVMLNAIPVLEPWEMPTSWGQLFAFLQNNQIALQEILQSFLKKNASKEFDVVALGFPISLTAGQPAVQIKWLFAQLPTIRLKNGFRNNESKNLQKARMWFGKDVKIAWTFSENWNKLQISSRGLLHEVLQQANLLLVGAGAVGSLMADILARLGCENITIVDSESVGVGNLSRHSLGLNSVRLNKAEMVAKKLNNIFPFINATAYDDSIETLINRGNAALSRADIIIDLTGEDEVISQLSSHFSGSAKPVVSISLGLNAKRLYCFVARPGENDDVSETFFRLVSPWLSKDKEGNKGSSLIREEIGCWHPIFPARLDDISQLLNTIVRPLELVLTEKINCKLIIAERVADADEVPTGITIKYE
ncbi:MAG: ThiF family adenylyltransferase [Candidatus Pseudobacter hemicellulosilyticus]|uniref:ThiF family adenylyltransferase n=1 Tax=Candidatus Pseudobacter hemicellulosilyticus TaxID=3121375 RepID=A0AAJ6BH67_9BACT|nr:MAG: ThiF family adenylyltransferase [Pseudobacter sp.]